MRKFFYDFAAAFGILDLLLLLIAIIKQTRINLETGGLIVFLSISLIWAIIMRASRNRVKEEKVPDDQKLRQLQEEITQIELTKKLYGPGGTPFTE